MIPPEDLCTAALLRSEERLSGTARTYLSHGRVAAREYTHLLARRRTEDRQVAGQNRRRSGRSYRRLTDGCGEPKYTALI